MRAPSLLVMLVIGSRLAAANPDAPSTAPAGAPPVAAQPSAPDPGEPSGAPAEAHPIAAQLLLGAGYTTFGLWAYGAWYAKHKGLGYYKWGGDDRNCRYPGGPGFFSLCELTAWAGSNTYAGGADKFGHAWSTMALARGGTELLSRYGGFDHLKSSLISAALADTLFFFVEVKDGYFYEFSYSDLGADTLGAIIAVLLDNFPRLDEMLDYRVQYFPSRGYLDNISGGNGYSRLNIAEDYSGETYLIAFHLGSIHALRDARHGAWSRFVDLAIGFDSRGYKPSPPMGYPPYEHHQDLFLGISFNAQGLFDWLLEDRASRAARTTRYITHGVFELFNLPYTALPVIDHRNVPNGPVMMGGA
ncbi:MAG TPA: DUF2279 domain-containing protein [Kofleriaceae bacterium]|nr:DUF2279 domain-containing protein [Kofleriaceae bacterium]